MRGKRVESNDDLENPGDYYPVKADDGSIRLLWAIAPNGFWLRLPAKPEEGNNIFWNVTENPDGTITVDPSIETWAAPSKEEAQAKGPDYYWHGHLVNGEWT